MLATQNAPCEVACELLKSRPVIAVETLPDLRAHIRQVERRVHRVLALLHVRGGRHVPTIEPVVAKIARVLKQKQGEIAYFRKILNGKLSNVRINTLTRGSRRAGRGRRPAVIFQIKHRR